MDLTQSTSTVTDVRSTGTRMGAAVFIAGVVTVVAVTVILAASSLTGPRVDIGTATQADPLTGPAAIQFRADEHGLGTTQADPLVGPAAIQFRADEHGLGTTQADPLTGPAAIQFRADEHGAASGSADPLLSTSAIEFRASEHQGAVAP